MSTHYRGTPQKPGRVLGLTRAASDAACLGCVYRIKNDKIPAAFAAVWEREMVSYAYDPCLIGVELHACSTDERTSEVRRDTSGETLDVLAFLADPQHEQYIEGETPAQAAAVIASAIGPKGTNREYFFDTYHHLQSLNVQDDYLDQIAECLQKLT